MISNSLVRVLTQQREVALTALAIAQAQLEDLSERNAELEKELAELRGQASGQK